MILMLITDRGRLAPGAAFDAALACLVRQARAAAEAGVDLIQVRERDLDGRRLAAVVRAVLQAVGGSRTRVVVNERVDVALATGAHGVHLRAASLDASSARVLVPRPLLIGRSVHDALGARTAGDVDYLVAGTVAGTPSKPVGHPLIGMDGLKTIVSATHVPVLAVGGIGPADVPAVASTGSSGIAAIGAWMADAGDCRATSLLERVDAFRRPGDAANMRGQLPTH
ncbi:MAG: thiamine phosphate synthase [Acidobacteria bacterium]|nr:thiamine phosphate synthase [Acidobacteriota bacterium]